MTREEILSLLFENQDLTYRDFHRNLIPTVDAQTVIGVRVPIIRKLAKQIGKCDDFLADLPHTYFEENQLHACILNLEKDFDAALSGVQAFLPFVDNWATCDILNPIAFKRSPDKLLPYALVWAQSREVYIMRFGVEMLMNHFLDEHFERSHVDLVASLRPKDYYGRMMIAWFFATALAKQYDAVIPYIENNRLERWTHNKSIQKAVESYRISDAQKAYLKSLRCK